MRVTALMLQAVNQGLSVSHVLEMRPKCTLTGAQWLTTQQIYTDFGPVGRIVAPGAFAASVSTALDNHRRGSSALPASLAATAILTTVALWRFGNEPVNRQVARWTADDLPQDWRARRDQWEFAHAASAALHTLAFTALLIPSINRQPSHIEPEEKP